MFDRLKIWCEKFMELYVSRKILVGFVAMLFPRFQTLTDVMGLFQPEEWALKAILRKTNKK